MKTSTKLSVTVAASLLGVALAAGGAYAATGSLTAADAPGRVLQASGIAQATPRQVEPVSAPAAAGIASVAADASSITVTGSLPTTDDPASTAVDIYELDPTQDPSAYLHTSPVATAVAPLATSAFRVTVPRFAGARDRYYSKYLAVARTENDAQTVGVPHYVDDVRFGAKNDYPFPQIADKKGLQVEMTDDAEQLGVRHGAINVAFNQLMITKEINPSNTITFPVDGKSFYFDRGYVESLDGQIKALSDNGALVDLILILYRDANPNSAFSQLVHPDAAIGKGTVYAFNTKTAAGLGYFKAAMEFLTQRYTRADQRYGRALGYIVGNEIDSAYVWQNMGDQSVEAFLEYYSRALRVAWQAARLAYSNPRVYVSLDHQWTAAYDPSHPLESYPGRKVVDGLAALSRHEGDFPWDVAYHPYPQNLFNPAFWQDSQATTGFDTPLITFKNIEVLPAYLRQPALTYQGRQRRIILSEQGCNTPGDSLDAQKLQAACYAYAYYKIRFLDGIDAFILHRHVDHQAEGGLRLGVWTWDSGRADYALPGDHKFIYDVFKYIDTSRSLEVTKFALPIIGIKDWAQAIPGFDPAQLDQRSIPQQVGTQIDGRPVRSQVVAGFEHGMDGWLASDNASSVEQVSGPAYAGTGALRLHFDHNLPAWSTDAKTWKGADVVFASPVDASRTPHLDLAVRIPTPKAKQFAPSNVLYAEIKVYGTDGRVAYGIARLDQTGKWTPLSLDLVSWPENRAITRIKVWVRGTTDDDWQGTFDLDQVAFSAEMAPTSAVRNIDVTAVASSRKGIGSTIALTVTNNDARPLDGHLEAWPCDGVSQDPESISLDGTAAAGGALTVTATITGYQPADLRYPKICLRYRGQELDVVLRLPPPSETVLYGFEDGTENWQPEQNVASVASVSGFPNGPGTPHGGTRALDAEGTLTAASALKTVGLSPSNALDLSNAQSVVAWIDAYGGAPGATGYAAEVTLYSGNESLTANLPSFKTDQWNEVVVDVGRWPYRNKITRIEIGFQAIGTAAAWAPHFQVDDVGYLD